MPQYKAFIGTREIATVTPEIQELYTKAAVIAARAGCVVITGAAPGADQLAAEAALSVGGKIKLVLPWKNYERDWVDKIVEHCPSQVEVEIYNIVSDKQAEWTRSVARYHPTGDKLSAGAFALHARNYGIVCDASTVVAIPNPNKPGGGGTGQGIRIAQAKGIQLFDLSKPGDVFDLTRRLDRAG